jgi:hypothetical protein
MFWRLVMIRSIVRRTAARFHRPLAPIVPVLAVAAGLAFGTAPAHAQIPTTLAVSDTLREVRLVDGSTFYGRIVAVENDRITLETTAGARIEVARGQLRSLRLAEGRMVDGQFWRDDPNKTRLFFAPTGRTLRAGEGYFGVYELFIPFLSYGLTDQITLSGGSPFYLGMFESAPPFYLAPKVQVVSLPQTQVSLGALALFVPRSWGWEEDESHSLGIVYGVGTFGDGDNALTTGLGWGYADGEFSSRPVLMVGGEARMGRATKLLTENWFVPGADGVVFSGGVRFFGERLSADVGLLGFAGSEGAGCCLPLVNFVYNFGRPR